MVREILPTYVCVKKIRGGDGRLLGYIIQDFSGKFHYFQKDDLYRLLASGHMVVSNLKIDDMNRIVSRSVESKGLTPERCYEIYEILEENLRKRQVVKWELFTDWGNTNNNTTDPTTDPTSTPRVKFKLPSDVKRYFREKKLVQKSVSINTYVGLCRGFKNYLLQKGIKVNSIQMISNNGNYLCFAFSLTPLTIVPYNYPKYFKPNTLGYKYYSNLENYKIATTTICGAGGVVYHQGSDRNTNVSFVRIN